MSPQTKLITDYFDSASHSYQEKSESLAWRLLRNLESKAVLRLLPPLERKTVLDACCGSGFYSRLMASRGPLRLTAVDLSSEMLVRVSQIPGVTARKGDVTSLNFTETFDVILCAGGLEFMEDPFWFFERAHLISKPGAHLVLLVPRQGFFGLFYRLFHRSHGLNVHLFRHAHLKELGLRKGWALRAIRYVHPYALVVQYEK